MKMIIYVLKLENDKYYIGKTNRSLNTRILEHFADNGSSWTKLYKPIKVIETIENVDDFDEDKYTKIYMKKYGIYNVRGGSYTQVKLPTYQLESLKYELKTVNNNCYRCNKKGHYIKDCLEEESEEDEEESDYEDESEEESDYEDKSEDESIKRFLCITILGYISSSIRCFIKSNGSFYNIKIDELKIIRDFLFYFCDLFIINYVNDNYKYIYSIDWTRDDLSQFKDELILDITTLFDNIDIEQWFEEYVKDEYVDVNIYNDVNICNIIKDQIKNTCYSVQHLSGYLRNLKINVDYKKKIIQKYKNEEIYENELLNIEKHRKNEF